MATAVRKIGRRVADAFEDLVYPRSTSAADQWQRVVMNRAVDAHLRSLDPPKHSAVEISGNAQADKQWKSFCSLNYPEFDLTKPLVDRGQYDVVICEQVLEHVVDPFAAARNLTQLCVPGGHVVVTTPFLIKVHEDWGLVDYWRFTPRGLRKLLENAGLRVDTVGHWGNRQCVYGNLAKWSAYRKWQPLGNRADTPVQVWAFARRPAESA